MQVFILLGSNSQLPNRQNCWKIWAKINLPWPGSLALKVYQNSYILGIRFWKLTTKTCSDLYGHHYFHVLTRIGTCTVWQYTELCFYCRSQMTSISNISNRSIYCNYPNLWLQTGLKIFFSFFEGLDMFSISKTDVYWTSATHLIVWTITFCCNV